MRKKLAGLALSGALLMGGAPFVGTAHANGDDGTDPVLCFVAVHSIIDEALHEYREGHLTGRDLRTALRGAAVFLGDCLTPTT